MTTPIDQDVADALVAEAGTVAIKVHWILSPSTLPFTEFTLSCRAKTGDNELPLACFCNQYKYIYIYCIYILEIVMV